MFEKTAKALWSEKDPRSVRSRDALRRAFAKLLETEGLDQITVRKIALAAGVGHTTFFRHYADKDEILRELVTDQLRDAMQSTRAGFSVMDTARGCLGICEYVENHRLLWRNLLTGGAADMMKKELLRLSERVAEKWPSQADMLPPELGVTLSAGGSIDVLTWWLRQADPLPAKQVAEILNRVIIAPLTRASFS